eukprot:7391963-Prymnesium_polylepis.1
MMHAKKKRGTAIQSPSGRVTCGNVSSRSLAGPRHTATIPIQLVNPRRLLITWQWRSPWRMVAPVGTVSWYVETVLVEHFDTLPGSTVLERKGTGRRGLTRTHARDERTEK